MNKNLSERNESAARVVAWLEGKRPDVSDQDLRAYIMLRTGDDDPLDTPPHHAYFDRVARELAERIYGEIKKSTER